ncbi:MAG: hypothetical protein IKC13_03615 [Elusimicrobiaceae bacterium]|nr:hypothetical protein [Elusimicrobiaceae bacterium]
MKKFLAFFILLFFSGSSFAWVFTTEAVELDTKSILLDKLISTRQLNVCIHVRHHEAGRDCNTSACADMHGSTKVLFEAAYRYWFSSLKNIIIGSGRQREFADILALLPDQLSFSYSNGPENNFASCDYHTFKTNFANIDLILMPFTHLTQWSPGALVEGGHYNKSGNPQQARAKVTLDFYYQSENFGVDGYPLTQGKKNTHKVGENNRSSFHTMTHELGHSLGLGDLYAAAVANSYNSRLYTTHHIMPGPKTDSIMNTSIGLTCDDMDGLVNLLDHYYGETRLKNSIRRQKGWLSFCQDKNIAYAYGLPFSVTKQEKEQYRIFATMGETANANVFQAPCADKVRQNYQQSYQGKNELKMRQAVADSLAQAQQQHLKKQELADTTARIAEYNQNALVCPVCGKKVLYGQDKYPYNANIGGVPYQMHVHAQCDKGLSNIKVTAGVFKQYGRRLK